MYKKSLGKIAENIVKKHYAKRGYEIIAENYYCRYGELDLIVCKNNVHTIVEIKTRRSHSFGWAEENTNQQKIDRMINSYLHYQMENNISNFYKLEVIVVEMDKKISLKRIRL